MSTRSGLGRAGYVALSRGGGDASERGRNDARFAVRCQGIVNEDQKREKENAPSPLDSLRSARSILRTSSLLSSSRRTSSLRPSSLRRFSCVFASFFAFR